jgi:hypothetical protein
MRLASEIHNLKVKTRIIEGWRDYSNRKRKLDHWRMVNSWVNDFSGSDMLSKGKKGAATQNSCSGRLIRQPKPLGVNINHLNCNK